MPNPTRTWQLISLALAVALIATLAERHHGSTVSRHETGTLPTFKSTTNLEHLALSPNTRRVHERYSL